MSDLKCGLCRDCRHWSVEDAQWCVGIDNGLGHCMKVREEYPQTKAIVVAQEEAELVTAPDFGCVQFEAK